MNSSINLLKTESKENPKRKKTTYILKIISIIFIFFVGLISIVLFVLNSRISISSVQNEEAVVLKNIAAQKDRLSKYYFLNDRLKGIEKVIKDRKNYTDVLNNLVSQIPQDTQVGSLEIDKGDISLSVSSSSLLPLNKFLNNMIDLSLNKHVIHNMTIESLTIDSQTGKYSLAIKAKI